MPHFAFLASSWSSEKLKQARLKISETFKHDSRGGVWVAEVEASQLKPDLVKDQLEIVDACLDAIESTQKFILVDNGSYGTNLADGENLTDSSFLELELFQAVLLNKSIYYLFIGQNMENSALYTLLNQIMPRGYFAKQFESIYAAFDEMPEIINSDPPRLSRGQRLVFGTSVGRLTQTISKERADYSGLFREPEFLQGRLCGPVSGDRDLDVAAHYLSLAKGETKTNRKLSRAWIAIRTLMNFHYAETREQRALRLWDQALSLWSEAAAWRGLHAHLWLGNVSALGSIFRIRQRLETPSDEKSCADLSGPLGSVYYSISKRVPRLMRRKTRARAEAYIAHGIETLGPKSAQSLLPMRGSIHFQNHRFRAAVRDYQTALDYTVNVDPMSADTGFLLTELGFAEVFCLKPRAGLQKIEEGLKLMDSGGSSPGFKTRAFRKHALVSMVNFAPRAALNSARMADSIAQEHGLLDQRTRLNVLLAYGRKGQDT